LSPSTEKLLASLAVSQAPEAQWREAWRIAFAQLRREVNLHPTGDSPSAVFEAAAQALRPVAAEHLPLAMGLVMHVYPLCALRGVPLPWWSAANHRRQRLLRAVDRQQWILGNAGSERVAGAQAPVRVTRSREGVRIDGTFDYVSLANVADLVLFSAPLDGTASLFCIASLAGDTVRIGTPRFSGTTRLADTCPVAFHNHLVREDCCVVVPSESALGCMTRYQRSWFQLLACDAHLARLEHLRQRWQVARTPDAVASSRELCLLRDFSLRLLDEAARPAAIDELARVAASMKLRVSWHCQAMAAAISRWDAAAAAELGYLRRQPLSDDRILLDIGACASVHQPFEVDQRHHAVGARFATRAHATEAATQVERTGADFAVVGVEP
jgi:hypothetical protein